MNRWIARNLFFHPVRLLLGQNVRKHLRPFAERERWPAERIAAFRDERLRKLVAHAGESVPYYRALFQRTGVSPGEIRGYDDLPRLPVLTKQAIRENERALCRSDPSRSASTRATSGSTGMTLHFRKDADALAQNDAVMYRCYSWYGIGIGDRAARFWGVGVKRLARLKDRVKDFLMNRVRISTLDLSPKTCERHYRRIARFRPDYIYGYTTALYGFCVMARERGLDLSSLGLKAAIGTAEKMYPHYRELLEDALQCPVVDEYGSSENGVIAFQCPSGNLHVMGDHVCMEFVDEQYRHVPPGELGRILITDLAGTEMPLIRYEIGDVGRACERACECGIGLPLMEVVEGRLEDSLRMRDGRLVHAAGLAAVTLKDDAVHEFRMIQEDLDRFRVQLVKSDAFHDGSERGLLKKLRAALGEDVAFRFEYLDRIPRERSGKLRYFVSELPESQGGGGGA